ncbi:MAG: CpsD/CapB family tyrosine-protein kinase [Chloroflexi bacterium]|nr:CpsD/CapB family tyrosine-protein kinase [Chloroflexota bacterium]
MATQEYLDTDMTDITDPTAETAADWTHGKTNGTAEGGYLQRRNNGALGLNRQEPREWHFSGVDDVFRGIYTRAGVGFTSEVLAVCSAIAGEGKTTVAVGLATTIAQDFPDRRVLLVETDFQRPALAQDFDVAATPGLVDCVSAGEPLQAAIRPTYLDNLHIVPVGGQVRHVGRPLRSSRIAALIDSMRQSYEVVILDLPPILANSDSVLLTDLADGAICVARSGVTPMNLVTKALEQLEEGKLRGVVLNGTQTSIPTWLQRLIGA